MHPLAKGCRLNVEGGCLQKRCTVQRALELEDQHDHPSHLGSVSKFRMQVYYSRLFLVPTFCRSLTITFIHVAVIPYLINPGTIPNCSIVTVPMINQSILAGRDPTQSLCVVVKGDAFSKDGGATQFYEHILVVNYHAKGRGERWAHQSNLPCVGLQQYLFHGNISVVILLLDVTSSIHPLWCNVVCYYFYQSIGGCRSGILAITKSSSWQL